jgi:LCP family protein required for cell wall assembly
MTRPQKITLAILSAIACGLFLLVLYVGVQATQTWSRQPLGPTLAHTTARELPATWTASPGAPPPSVTFAPSSTFETATPPTAIQACYNLPPMMILAVGTDARSDEYRHGRADVMRAFRVDFTQQRVTALEFPRDLWVEIPGIETNLNTDHQKLNTAYTYGNPDYGPDLLARTLELNFGLSVDHYIVANMNVFVDIVDALGGLDITIPEGGIDGRTSSDRSARLVFAEGPQHLSGEQALTLARIRNVSVFQRAEHQNLVMCALRKELELPQAYLRLPAILDSFVQNVRTDLTPEQISQLACLGTHMPRSNISFTSFPLKFFHTSQVYDPVLKQNVFVWDVDFDTLRWYVSEFQAGTWPSSSPLGTPAPESSSCK